MSVLRIIKNHGVQASIDNTGGLKLKGLSRLTTEEKNQIVEFARNNKPEIIAALSQSGAPGDCKSCPAGGYWDFVQYAGQGLFCFHSAYFLGKPGTPKPCTEMRGIYPRKATR